MAEACHTEGAHTCSYEYQLQSFNPSGKRNSHLHNDHNYLDNRSPRGHSHSFSGTLVQLITFGLLLNCPG